MSAQSLMKGQRREEAEGQQGSCRCSGLQRTALRGEIKPRGGFQLRVISKVVIRKQLSLRVTAFWRSAM